MNTTAVDSWLSARGPVPSLKSMLPPSARAWKLNRACADASAPLVLFFFLPIGTWWSLVLACDICPLAPDDCCQQMEVNRLRKQKKYWMMQYSRHDRYRMVKRKDEKFIVKELMRITLRYQERHITYSENGNGPLQKLIKTNGILSFNHGWQATVLNN